MSSIFRVCFKIIIFFCLEYNTIIIFSVINLIIFLIDLFIYLFVFLSNHVFLHLFVLQSSCRFIAYFMTKGLRGLYMSIGFNGRSISIGFAVDAFYRYFIPGN